MVQRILEVLDAECIDYRHYTEDCLIECDLGGADDFAKAVRIIYENIEQWTYELLIDCKIELDLPFERISIKY